MNNVDLKFMRSIVNSKFGNEKVDLLDDYYYEKVKISDKDVLSIIRINSTIVDSNFIFSSEYIKYIYHNLFPSIKKGCLDILLIDLFVNKFQKVFSIKRILSFMADKNMFPNLNPQIFSIIICKLFFQKFKKYFVFHPKYYNSIIILLGHNDEKKYFKSITEIVSLNKNYYKIKKIYTINSIKAILNNCSSNLSFFHLNRIYLFGSYVKNRQNEYSDLDFHIYTNLQMNLDEQEVILSFYFNNLFDTCVDVKLDYNINNDIMFKDEIIVYKGAPVRFT